jgi:hypothetical protein
MERTIIPTTESEMEFVDRLVKRKERFPKPNQKKVLEELMDYFKVQSAIYWETEGKNG